MQAMALNLFLVATSGLCIVSILICIIALVQIRNLKIKNALLSEKQDTNSGQIRKKIDTMEYVQVQFGHDSTHLLEKVDDMNERINRIEVRDSQFASYHHAAKLIELGADQNEIIKTCGLSRAEADLVVMVNRHSKSNQSSSPSQDIEDQA